MNKAETAALRFRSVMPDGLLKCLDQRSTYLLREKINIQRQRNESLSPTEGTSLLRFIDDLDIAQLAALVPELLLSILCNAENFDYLDELSYLSVHFPLDKQNVAAFTAETSRLFPHEEALWAYIDAVNAVIIQCVSIQLDNDPVVPLAYLRKYLLAMLKDLLEREQPTIFENR